RACSRRGYAPAQAGPRLRDSGSWRSRCPGTPRRGAGRPRRSASGARASGFRLRWCCSWPSLDEGEAVLADLELVAGLEPRAVDATPVDEGAVQRALVV